MGKSVLGRIVQFVLLVLVAAMPAAASAESWPYGEGLLWRVERIGQSPSFVFGTLHSSDELVTDLPPPVAAAFDGASILATEVVLDEQAMASLLQAMSLPLGRNLSEILSPEIYSDLKLAAAHYRMPMSLLSRLKPWAIMTLFSLPPAEYMRNRAGLVPLDEKLQFDARAAGKRLVALESAEEQIAALDGVSEQDQVALLAVTLVEAADIERNFGAMRDAYLSGNLVAIRDRWNRSVVDHGEAAGRFEDRLIEQRNHKMVARMADLLRQGNAFIAVGALHLPGESGILNLLAGQGYKIDRVY
ncbi:MAG: TraB/GumN family protein [Dongiaceae bacterium]